MRKAIYGLGLSLLALTGAARADASFSGLYVFGDSLSDNGNIPKLYGVEYPAPPYYTGRFSNGPVYAEYLPGLLGISQANFADYAIGGATTGASNISSLLPAGSGMEGELSRYLATDRAANSRDLFVVWGGANDFFGLADNPGSLAGPGGFTIASINAAVNQTASTAVTNLTAEITRLAATGARNFIVPNLPDLGLTPELNGSALTQFIGSTATATTNAELAAAMHALQQRLGVNIVVMNVQMILNEVVARPAAYGLTNLTAACDTGTTVCANPSSYLFWDDVHPTAGIHEILAEYMASAVTAPKALGSSGDIGLIGAEDLFDQIGSRTTALREGISGLAVSGFETGRAAGNAPEGSVSGGTDPRLGVYLTGGYGWGSRDDRTDTAGFDYQRQTAIGGVDYRLTPNFAVGGMFGYGNVDADLNDGFGRISDEKHEGALYATYFNPNFYLTLAGTYAQDEWDFHRNTFVLDREATGKADGNTRGGKVETGYAFQQGPFTFGPVGELRYANVHIDGYSEDGAVALNETVNGQTVTSLIGEIGLQAAMTTSIGNVGLSPHLRIAYDNEFENGDRILYTSLVSQSETYVATTIQAPKSHWFRLGGGTDIQLAQRFSARVDVDATVGRGDGEDYSAQAKLRYAFN